MSMSRGEQAYNLRQRGMSWIDVATAIDASLAAAGNAATAVAKKFAVSRGLPWPLALTKAPKQVEEKPDPVWLAKQKEAYDLRVEGFMWAEVAELTGYKQVNHAVTAAQKHAARMSLPWPIQKTV